MLQFRKDLDDLRVKLQPDFAGTSVCRHLQINLVNLGDG